MPIPLTRHEADRLLQWSLQQRSSATVDIPRDQAIVLLQVYLAVSRWLDDQPGPAPPEDPK